MTESDAFDGPRLRIAVLGDFESIHTRRYVSFFAERGHEMHAISYYEPSQLPVNVRLHTLVDTTAPSSSATTDRGPSLREIFQAVAPPALRRIVHGLRYQRAGLGRVVDGIKPDVFHAHYVVEHGFYGALANTHPFVVTAWGSDLLRDSYTVQGRLIARWTLGRADYVTGNDASLLRRARELGVPPERTGLVRIGIDPLFLDARSVNLDAQNASPPTVISDRALEPLYNVETVLLAFARVRARIPNAHLTIAGHGSQATMLRGLARSQGVEDAVTFTGRLPPEALRDALASAHVYVSVPQTDSMAVSNLEAMAAGVFPVLSDLPSIDGWIKPGVNGLLVAPSPTVDALADALHSALTDAARRQAAIATNRGRVEAEGKHERNMLLLERIYYRLAGHPVAEDGVI